MSLARAQATSLRGLGAFFVVIILAVVLGVLIFPGDQGRILVLEARLRTSNTSTVAGGITAGALR